MARFFPTALYCYEHLEGFQIVDQGGCIITLEEWEEIDRKARTFFANVDHSSITEHNANKTGQQANISAPMSYRPSVNLPEHINAIAEMFGWTYLVKTTAKEGVKIGFTSKQLRTRLSQLSKEYQSPIYCLDAFQNKFPDYIEAQLHKHFESKRIEGEFYDLSDDDLLAISQVVNDLCIGRVEVCNGRA